MTTHTPRPLTHDGRFVMAVGRCDTIDGPVHGIIAECLDTTKHDDDGREWTVGGTAVGNAQLFAAAPDLLAAMKKVVAISDRKHDAWDEARAAIAKATDTEAR
jgi:hypothetical protein